MARGDELPSAVTFTAITEGAEQTLIPGSGAALRAGAAMHGAIEGGGSVVQFLAARPGVLFAMAGSQAQLGPDHESLRCQ